MNDFDEFEKDLLGMAANFNRGKETKKFLKKQARKLNKKQKRKAEESIKTNTLGKSENKRLTSSKNFKAGRVYNFKSNDLSVRAYAKAPHSHLVNNGHIIRVRGPNYKEGETRGSRVGKTREVGFAPGVHFMEKAQKEFKNQNYEDTKNFIDEMLDKHGMG